MIQEQKKWFVVLCGLLFLIYGSFLSHRINLVTADLGRHIKNGEQVLNNFSGVFSTNFYSYTTPDFPVINHHWGSGLIFYVLWKAFGFTGLHLFFIAVSFATFFIMFWSASIRAGPGIAGFAALAAIPLLAERTEIRPEALSYFFAAIFFYLLVHAPDSSWPRRKIFLILPLIEILWVNMHIYFFLGPIIIAVFALNAIGKHGLVSSAAKRIFLLLGLVSIAMLFNPAHIRGVIAPLTIFQNYGYMIAENKSVWFLEKLIANPNFIIIKIVGTIAIASVIARIVRSKKQAAGALDRTRQTSAFLIADILLLLGFGAMAFAQTRNFALFGFFAIPLISGHIAAAFSYQLAVARQRAIAQSACIAAIVALFVLMPGSLQRAFPYWREFGWGLQTGTMTAADFLKQAQIKGPIFNDYDIGGYLIFSLFPEERVFVDNRPEAYPASFFQKTYIPMQESAQDWQTAGYHYDFNAIIFSSTDMTPWGQQFLITRIQDPQWIPVFADASVIIFVKNNEVNRSVIAQYAISRDHFRIIRQ